MVVDHRRELLGPEFRAARDWGDLEQRLRAHGYLLESTGRGLVVTDGDIRTSASRIAREYSYMNLAERFGQSYDAWRVDQGRVRDPLERSEEHTSELQSLMRISYAVFCLKKKKT